MADHTAVGAVLGLELLGFGYHLIVVQADGCHGSDAIGAILAGEQPLDIVLDLLADGPLIFQPADAVIALAAGIVHTGHLHASGSVDDHNIFRVQLGNGSGRQVLDRRYTLGSEFITGLHLDGYIAGTLLLIGFVPDITAAFGHRKSHRCSLDSLLAHQCFLHPVLSLEDQASLLFKFCGSESR